MSETVKDVLVRFPGATVDKLIPILQETQNAEGFLTMDAINAVAAHLGVSAGAVYGVATFYNQFRFTPSGKCRVTACRGTACHVRGGKNVIDAVSDHLGVPDGGTTPDMEYTFETIACLGACALAPVMVVDSKYYGKMTPKKAATLLGKH